MSDTNYNEEIDEATPETVAEWLVNVTAGDQIPCDSSIASCLTVLDKKIHFGQPQISPKVVASLCTGCRAHYYAQMARNAIIDHAKVHRKRGG